MIYNLLLKFPVKFINKYKYDYLNNINYYIYIHIHTVTDITLKFNNFLFNMINYKIKLYKKIINNSSNIILKLNRSNIKKRKQKGCGRARVGSLKSSVSRGGGVIFGPSPRFIKLKINSKEWVKVYKSIIINKRCSMLWFFLNKMIINYTKKEFYFNFLYNLGISTQNTVLFFIISKNHIFINKKHIHFSLFKNINILKIISVQYIIYLI
uniref:Large ribosomal subunit protein uL4m n=1 Tax=Hepatozoon canis TaxID=110120 RepID=A0A3Q8THM8_9APIC|nr:ribosomal protein L4 [Hepatozoon canis]